MRNRALSPQIGQLTGGYADVSAHLREYADGRNKRGARKTARRGAPDCSSVRRSVRGILHLVDVRPRRAFGSADGRRSRPRRVCRKRAAAISLCHSVVRRGPPTRRVRAGPTRAGSLQSGGLLRSARFTRPCARRSRCGDSAAPAVSELLHLSGADLDGSPRVRLRARRPTAGSSAHPRQCANTQ